MNLVIDIGNSFIKVAFFNQAGVIAGLKKFQHDKPEDINEYLDQLSISHAVISDVSGKGAALLPQLEVKKVPLLLVDHQTPVPITVSYESPQTLGSDRLAAAVGAYHHFKGQDTLVINTGTCITYELLTADGNYLGGMITPGMDMRMKAMHTFTGKLPLLTLEENPPFIGQNTADCLQSGTINGVVCEAEGIISRLEAEVDSLNVVVSGGYATYLASKLKKEIFALPNLVLEGLNEILLYNIER